MNSVAPPPVGGGNSKYVAVLLLFGVGIAALVYSRMSSAPSPVVQTPAIASSVPTISHRDDDFIPPPPPIPDASVDTTPKKASSFTAATGCEPKACTGTSTSELEGAVGFRAKQAHRCYDTALAADSSLKGLVKIKVRVSPNGAVCSASVAANEMGSPAVAQCVADKFRQAQSFPAPKGGCLDVTVPINFTPGGK
jgi:TonB family protein